MTTPTARPTTPATAAALVGDAKQQINNLSVEEFAAELERPDVVVIDLRESEELPSGRIAGSVHVPRGMLEFRADPTSPYHNGALDPSRRTLLTCASGGRSALAAVTLQRMGYRDVAHLDGGFKAWTEAGCPIETP